MDHNVKSRGSLSASFLSFWHPLNFIFFLFVSLAVDANQSVANSPQWHALLHLEQGKPLINSDKFLLSHGNFSLLNELNSTISLLEHDSQGICQFPARASFLYENRLIKNKPDFSRCKDYVEFLDKAPAESISVVYSSENLFSASSMMGHIMLKTEGTTSTGMMVEHGVSFFTNIDSLNIPKIMYESLFVGKHGFFQISPYHEKLNFYLNDENRNVWEYQLSLDKRQVDLLQAHFWELGNADLPYFFHTYNCATVTQLILRVVYPELDESLQGWLSPLDVVKNVNELGKIVQTKVIPPADWKMRMLQDALSSSAIADVKSAVLNMDTISHYQEDVNTHFISWQLAQTYNDYLFANGERTSQERLAYSEILNANSPENFDEMYLDLAEYKSPLSTPGDAQQSVGFYRELEQNWLFYEYLPAGRNLEDDNRQFFSENELGISSLRVAFNPERQKLRLDHWHIYRMRSIIPFDTFSGGLSSQFKVGFEQHRDEQLEPDLAFNVTFGVGLAEKFFNDGRVYAGINAGLGYSAGDSYIYYYPEVGFFLYEIFNMKSTLLAQRYYNLRGESEALNRIVWQQSFFIGEKYSVVTELDRYFNSDYADNRVALKFKYFY